VTIIPAPAPVITVTHCLTPNTSGLTASVPANAGDTYNWTITGGTIDSGQGTDTISFTSGGPATLMTLTVDETNPTGCVGSTGDSMEVNFLDVPPSNPFYNFICTIARHAITAGCGSGNFCPANNVLRSQMAVFLLRGEHGSIYVPPAADCGTYPFSDVTCPSIFADYILQAYNEGITGGCSTNPLLYCPANPVSRAGMAVFLLVAEHGTGYVPPACAGIFTDVACPSPFADWIEQLYNEGITGGCSTTPLMYCPGNSLTRAQMSVFLTVTFALP
jgi:PKD domain-containing protein/S-layer family protein